MHVPGDVVELVDTLGLEPSAARRGGSTPSIPTILNSRIFSYILRGFEMLSRLQYLDGGINT